MAESIIIRESVKGTYSNRRNGIFEHNAADGIHYQVLHVTAGKGRIDVKVLGRFKTVEAARAFVDSGCPQFETFPGVCFEKKLDSGETEVATAFRAREGKQPAYVRVTKKPEFITQLDSEGHEEVIRTYPATTREDRDSYATAQQAIETLLCDADADTITVFPNDMGTDTRHAERTPEEAGWIKNPPTT